MTEVEHAACTDSCGKREKKAAVLKRQFRYLQVHGSVNQVCPHSRAPLSKAGSIRRNGSALIHSQINENENACVL